jgi:hypothetical protein
VYEHVFVCWRPADPAAYGYLLGVYLGDGWVGDIGRTGRIMISLDDAYPRIIHETIRALELCADGRPIRRRRPPGEAFTVVYSYGRHWLDAFPQYGRGPKHERPIVLAPWQRAIVEADPRPFLRGLIHSDGCRVINRFKTLLPSGRLAEYAYPRYFFSNLSADIRGLFCVYCERLGVRWTQSNPRNISVSHRRSVAILDEFVGPKA